jgi:hypothetical protein
MRHFLTFTALALTFLSCGSSVNYQKREMIVGVYCGECRGDCFQGYTLTGDSVTKISAKFNDQLRSSSEAKASSEEAGQVNELLGLLPADINNYKGKYGCPDCHDQCGIYLSLKNNSRKTIIFIDPDEGKHPKELDAFVRAVNNLKLL